ncbi:hypothetical protein [Neorhizobium petrolearium]|uniref:Dynamin n=2 Tax=Neorhizobium TaxID=1525371 RepID=A0ABY8M3N5_9HYPH|nr:MULTISPECIES: hypothetical protein [Rhizobium/Agrobacterium group]MCC2613260.1 hypothetical protein [Neorhizobium petrolearium]WGI68349.1 hypothetical protein QEO92_25900 [Neorhizobium petrolearium]
MDTRPDPKGPEKRHPNPIGSPVEEPMSPTEARQGRRGFPVLMVLIAGLILAMLAWGGAEWWGETTAPPPEQTATPPAGSTAPQNPDAAPSADPANPPAPTPPAGNAPANN